MLGHDLPQPRSRPPAWSPGVTGTWWNGMPYDCTSGSRSRWFDTTAGMSMLSAPDRQRNSRSLRQCPNRLTMTQGAVRRRRVPDRPLHAVCRRHGCEQLTPPRRARAADLDGEPDPHEELVGADVVELLALLDVRPVLEEQRGHRGDDAPLVGAGQDEDVLRGSGGVGHPATVRAPGSGADHGGPRRLLLDGLEHLWGRRVLADPVPLAVPVVVAGPGDEQAQGGASSVRCRTASASWSRWCTSSPASPASTSSSTSASETTRPRVPDQGCATTGTPPAARTTSTARTGSGA